MRGLVGIVGVGAILLGSSAVAGVDPKYSTVEVECGDIVEGEFASSFEGHYYDLTMAPGDALDLAVIPVGEHLKWEVNIEEPGGNLIFEGRRIRCGYTLKNNTNISSGVLSSRGRYRISVWNFNCENERYKGRHGVYAVHIGCKLRDGTTIKPGERRKALPPPPAGPPLKRRQAPATERPADFKGFPGLDPISFAGVAFPKLGLGIPLEGTISTDGEVFGYRFEGRSGQSVALNFTKTSGNLNLALVLLDAKGRVVFQSSLVTARAQTTQLELPAAGEYTLGVAPIALLPPARPSATSFTIEIGPTP